MSIKSFAKRPPFSFIYDGKPSSTLLPRWRLKQTSAAGRGGRQHLLTWTAPDGLRVIAAVLAYEDHPAIEWAVEFVAPEGAASKQLSRILAIDTALDRGGRGAAVVHTNHGSSSQTKDFRPVTESPGSGDGQFLLYSSCGGRSTSQYPGSPSGIPYFNIDWGGDGHIVALGWPGQWGMQISLDDDGDAALQGGMTSRDGFFTGKLPADATIDDLGPADLYLEAGERIRTPMVVALAWKGDDWIDGQNQWRRWMLEYNTPLYDDKPPAPIGAAGQEAAGWLDADADLQMEVWKAYVDQGITTAQGGGLEWFWIDTGWFPIPDSVDREHPEAWTYTGNHWADPERYPNGVREVTDYVRETGGRMVLWLEIERCRPGTWLADNHPEWLLEVSSPTWLHLDWGNPEAFEWALETTSKLVEEEKFELYRIDFNFNGPLLDWNLTDPDGRSGITQATWCMGFLAYLDALRERHPDLIIESCASGGRRLDIATLRRCISMTKTDVFWDPTTSQATNHALSSWLVCHGSAGHPDSMYTLRSAMAWNFVGQIDGSALTAPQEKWDRLGQAYTEWAAVSENFFGDFYPLTSNTLDPCEWIGSQYHRSDAGEGVMQMFAHPDSTGSHPAVLRGLKNGATYEVTNYDDPDNPWRVRGKTLMTEGITIAPPVRPYAALLSYRQV